MDTQPPKRALQFLRWFCREDYLDEVEGDLIEIFELQSTENLKKANRSFWWQVIRHFRPDYIKSLKKTPKINPAMFKNYFIVAMRLFVRNRLISGINVSGLALALTGSLLIMLFIADELSYDRHHAKADSIYRVTRNFLSSDGSETLHLGLVAPPYGPLLQNDFPAISEMARTHKIYNSLRIVEEDGLLSENIHLEHPFYAEPTIFNLFDISILVGDTKTPLEKPFTTLISDAMAEQHFGMLDVVGKEIKSDNITFEITGVYEAFPEQSHWHPDMLVAFSTLKNPEVLGIDQLEDSWSNNDFSTYILIENAFDAEKVQAQFPEFLDKHMGSYSKLQPSTWTSLFLQPLTSIHLHSQLDHEIENNGNINNIYIMGAIGVFLLLISGFNFINLTTARSTTRSKEVGLRKALGAHRKQLIIQHLSESTFIAILSFIVAILLTSLILPWLNAFTGKSIQLQEFITPINSVAVLGFILMVGILAGLYPAFVLSRFNPSRILKQHAGLERGGQKVRQTLVIAQFTISLVMIIATLVVYQQLDFLNNHELGYAKNQVIRVYYSNEIDSQYEAFNYELTKHASIKEAGRSSTIPTDRLLAYTSTSFQKGDSLIATDLNIKNVTIDDAFFSTYQIPLVSGRDFSKERSAGDSASFIINEAAAQMIGWSADEAVGKMFQNGQVKGTIVGVVKDFHFESLHEPIVPIVFLSQPHFNYISVQVTPNDVSGALIHMEKVWKTFVPNEPFQYRFLSERYEQLYSSEQRQSSLFLIFAGLAIFIATIGLFGLATFNVLQRVKEIGVRKVLGASIGDILSLLSKEIVWILFLANVIAWPIAWYFMEQWLTQFAYSIELTWWMFTLAGIVTLLVAIITISFQSLKAALANPVKSLRSE